MADNPHPPVAPITVRIDINGDDWEYVVRRLSWLADEAEQRDPRTFGRMFGGGAGGSYSTNVSTRDVTVEQYHAELEEWRQSLTVPTEAGGG